MALYLWNLSSNIEYMVIDGEDIPGVWHPQCQSYYPGALMIRVTFRSRQIPP